MLAGIDTASVSVFPIRWRAKLRTQARPSVKRRTRMLLTSRILSPLWSGWTKDAATIFMLHRFTTPHLGIAGHDPQRLASHLAELRERRYHLCSLRELIARMDAGLPPLPKTVVFTVDDGYSDFADIGAPIFEHYDCPVTAFVATAFLDGHCWLWYDAVEFLVGVEQSGHLRLASLNGRTLAWDSHTQRRAQVAGLVEFLKTVCTSTVELVIQELQSVSRHGLPARPTPGFAAMTWSAARSWAGRGADFAPHSHTHPILARSAAERVEYEIATSWKRIREEIPTALPVICYPVGMPNDFTCREREIARASGLHAAISAFGGHCTLTSFQTDRFALPRISYEEEPSSFRQAVGGLERFKERIRMVLE